MILKYLFKISRIFLILICVFLAAGYFLLYSNMGLCLIVKTATLIIPGQLEIRKIHGTLQNFLIYDISYQQPSFKMNADKIALNWNVKSLLKTTLKVNAIHVSGLIIQLDKNDFHYSSEPTTSFINKWSILSHLQFDKIDMDRGIFSEKILGKIEIYELKINKKSKYYNLNVKTDHGNLMGTLYGGFNQEFYWETHLIGKSIFLSPFSTKIKTFKLYSTGKIKDSLEECKLQLTGVKAQFKNLIVTGLVNLQYEKGLLLINSSHFTIGKNFINFSGKLNDQYWNAFYKLDVSQLQDFVPSIEGKLISQGKITGSKNSSILALKINLTKLRTDSIKLNQATINVLGKVSPQMALKMDIITTPVNIKSYRIQPIKGWIGLNRNSTKMYGNFYIDALNNKVAGSYQLPEFFTTFTKNQPITSNVHFSIPELNKLIAKVPYTKNLRGNISGDLLLNGTILEPRFKMAVKLLNGEAYIPQLNVQFNQINLTAISSDSSKIFWQGKAVTSTGNLQVNGLTYLKPDINILIELAGKNIYLINTKEYKVLASPQITINYAKSTLGLSGKILIPSARLTPMTFNNVVTLPQDVIFKYKNSHYVIPTLNIKIHLKLTLGDDVFISYHNLTSNLIGSLTVIKKEDVEPTAIGDLNTKNGLYKAYGRMLVINKGRLVYVGNPFSNPGLDIEAVHQINTVGFASSQWIQHATFDKPSDKIKVGVKVQGSLNQPRFMLISTPSMNQNDILSYLLFDSPANALSSNNSLALMNTILSFNQGNTTTTIDDVKNKLGAFGISIQNTSIYDPTTNTNKNTSAVSIGKKLSKNLSITYQAGIFDHYSVMGLRYKLGKYWTLQTQNNPLETTFDILYELEK